jgi:hypothetical protein
LKHPVNDALEQFAAALQKVGADPSQVEVSLPLDEWRALAVALDVEKGGPVPGDIGRIEIAGVKYLVRFRP